MRGEDGRDTAYFQNCLLPGCGPSVILVTAHGLLGGTYVGVDKDGAYTVKLSVLLSDVHRHVHIPYSKVQLPHTFHYSLFERKTKQAVFANTVVFAVAKVCVMRVCVCRGRSTSVLCAVNTPRARCKSRFLPRTCPPCHPHRGFVCAFVCLCISVQSKVATPWLKLALRSPSRAFVLLKHF